MLTPVTTIELKKDYLEFSSGHFTLFSATEREPLHGHNYTVQLLLEVRLQSVGLNFDYRFYKKTLRKLCESLNHYTLLPSQSPFLRLRKTATHIFAEFNGEEIPFLQKDVICLPLSNITVEELSKWFVLELTQNQQRLQQDAIMALTVKVFSAPGQSGSATWEAEEHA